MHLIGCNQSSVQSETSSFGAYVGKEDEFKMSDLKKLQEQECYMEEREESKQEHN